MSPVPNRRWFWTVAVLALLTAPCDAATMYVTDSIDIMVRGGPSVEHKIITTLKSNSLVEVLEQDQQWTKISLPNGSEGYVMTRYLTEERPAALMASELEEKLRPLEQEVGTLREEKQRLEDLVSEQSATMQDQGQKLAALREEYEEWKNSARDHISLKQAKDSIEGELAGLEQKYANLAAAHARLTDRKDTLFMLSGGGLLFVGLIVGFVMGRILVRRRRRIFT